MERRIHHNSIKSKINLNKRLDFVCNYATHLVNKIIPVDITLGDMGFDDEGNHVGAEQMGICSIIPTRYVDVPIYRTSGIHRKEMKRNFPEQLYHQRNKSETIFFVVKQIMSGDITSRNQITQDNEMLLRLVAYNSYRITKLEFVVLAWFLQGPWFRLS